MVTPVARSRSFETLEESLMNAVAVRRRAMQYRDQEFQYELQGDEPGTEAAREQAVPDKTLVEDVAS
jgi:hypothetical protein